MLDTDDHFKIIEQAVFAGNDKSDAAWRTESWSRCLHDYNLDPSHPHFVELSNRELKHESEMFDYDIGLAGKELEKTLLMIEGGGYSASIANRNGVIIAERRSQDSTFYCGSDKVGSVWTEEVGGTNGIGTALTTLVPAAVYLSDHFFADLTVQACAAAPFFGPAGDPLGVVNLSTQNPGLPQLAHRVVFGVAQITAQRLETKYFRERFRKHFIMTITAETETPALVALDGDYRVVGATRAARMLLNLDDSTVGFRGLWGIFEKSHGNPTLENLCESVSELRPLGSRRAFDVTVQLPSSMPAQPRVMPTARPAKKAQKRIATLAECAGNDPQMARNLSILRRVFDCGLHVLLLGETGVGKDTVTRALHHESARASGPFVAFNCSAVPESLIDSELFGYSSGAFTGASKEGNVGRIVEADKGTLFLDEIGDMPLTLQTRLLRFLETHEVMPLGSGKMRAVDVQVVAATHQNLSEKVAMGTFRQDLFYRLAGAVVTFPPLRERTDLDFIIETLIGQISGDRPLVIGPAAHAMLLAHDWPGNIRELRNVLTRAARLANDAVIEVEDLMLSTLPSRIPSESLFDPEAMVRSAPSRAEGVALPRPPVGRAVRGKLVTPHKTAVLKAERDEMERVISECGGDVLSCCRMLEISRATFYRKLKQHELSLRSPT